MTGSPKNNENEIQEGNAVRITEIQLIDGLFLIGPPGIGKTEIIRQRARELAEKMNLKFVDLREVTDEQLTEILHNASQYCPFYRIAAPHLLPEDLGLPHKNTNGVKYAEIVPQKVLAIFTHPSLRCGVLFIDELNNVQREDVITLLFTLILEKEASWYLKLNPNVVVVAAGNPPSWSSVANSLPLPMRMGRLIPVNVKPPSVEEWIQYMDRNYGDNWERLIAAYLTLYPEDLIATPPSVDEDDGLSAVPSPRSWTKLATLLPRLKAMNASKEFIEQTIIGLVGQRVGRKVAALLLANINIKETTEKVLKNPETFDELNETEKILILDVAAQDPIRFKGLAKYLANKARDYLMIMLVLMKKEKRLMLLKDEDYRKILLGLAKELKDYIIG